MFDSIYVVLVMIWSWITGSKTTAPSPAASDPTTATSTNNTPVATTTTVPVPAIPAGADPAGYTYTGTPAGQSVNYTNIAYDNDVGMGANPTAFRSANVYSGAWWQFQIPAQAGNIAMKGFQLYSENNVGDTIVFSVQSDDGSSTISDHITATCTEVYNVNAPNLANPTGSQTTWIAASSVPLSSGTTYRMVANQFPSPVWGNASLPVDMHSNGPWPPTGAADSFYPYFVLLF